MKRCLILLLAAALSFAAASFYSVRINPEIALYRPLVAEQHRALQSADHRPRVLVIGGSSAMFSIDPALLHDEFGISAVNLGIPAGAGRALQTEMALEHARRGDLVVIAFETGAYSRSTGVLFTPLGSQLWYGAFAPHFPNGSRLAELGIDPAYSPLDLRPGGQHTLTLFVKLALRLPLNRYSPDDMRTGGFMVTEFRTDSLRPSSAPAALSLNPDMRKFLEHLVQIFRDRGARVAFSLPWQFLSPEAVDAQRAHNQNLARELESIAPVLGDPHWGAQADPALFADTEWHLRESAAQSRSRILARSLLPFLPAPPDP